MTDVAARIDELRLAVGEVDTLAAVTLKWFDGEDWSSADPVLFEHAGFMLGVIAKSAAFAASKIDGFHVAIADTQPVPTSQEWNYSDGTAPGKQDPMMPSDHGSHR